jgi:hypothetical protein
MSRSTSTCRVKPGAERIEAMVGDMASTRVDGE